jgi:hypothetical protein
MENNGEEEELASAEKSPGARRSYCPTATACASPLHLHPDAKIHALDAQPPPRQEDAVGVRNIFLFLLAFQLTGQAERLRTASSVAVPLTSLPAAAPPIIGPSTSMTAFDIADSPI